MLSKRMRLSRHFIGLVIALLITALSAAATPMAPSMSQQAEFFPHQHAFLAEHSDVYFAARAPPLAAVNVAFTGAAVAEHGNGIVMHGHAIHVASFAFGVGLDATNNGVPSNWTQLNPAGVQINRPTGFTTYRTKRCMRLLKLTQLMLRTRRICIRVSLMECDPVREEHFQGLRQHLM
jgi:hypothetical protein